MFETSQVRARALPARGRISMLLVSVALHTAVVIGAIGASVASVEFPREAPDQMELVQVARAVPLAPPAKGRPDAKPNQAAAAEKPVQRTPEQPLLTPQVVPDSTPAADPLPSGGVGTGEGPSGPVGVPDGVDGGVGTGDAGVGTGTTHEPEQIYQAGGDVKPPKILSRIDPRYPQIAVQAKKSGMVVLSCIIDKEGRIRDVKVLTSSFPPFEQAAADAVRQWTFAPGTLNGRPVDVIFNLTVTFNLTR